MPRILFVKRYHYTRFAGGAEEQSWLLATEFARRGWDVHYASEMNVVPGNVDFEGVTMHGLPEDPPYLRGNRIPLRNLIGKLQPDVVYIRSFDIYTRDAINEAPRGAVTMWASAMVGDGKIWPRLLQMRRLTSLPVYLKRLPIHFGIFASARPAVRRASLVFVQSPEQINYFQRQGLDTHLVRNVQASVPESAVQTHNGTPVVFWAGSLKAWKRPELFIELARRCQDLKATFVMIGAVQEPRYADIMAQAKRDVPNLVWDGAIPLPRVHEYFSRAHVFVSTSIQESYPNTFIHSWLHGVPVVSLDVDPESLLSAQGLGQVVGSVDELEHAVRDLAADPDRRRAIGQEARAYAVKEHDLGQTVDRIEQLLKSKGVKLPEHSTSSTPR